MSYGTDPVAYSTYYQLQLSLVCILVQKLIKHVHELEESQAQAKQSGGMQTGTRQKAFHN